MIFIKLNVELISELIKEDFQGNYKDFAKAINVNSVTVYRILTNRSNAGEKFISNFMAYCKNKQYEIEQYFF
jgi:hypothetical protein